MVVGAATRDLPPVGADHRRAGRVVPWGRIDPLFEAVAQVVEEAVLNALVANREMTGHRGHRGARPADRALARLTLSGAISVIIPMSRETGGHTVKRCEKHFSPGFPASSW